MKRIISLLFVVLVVFGLGISFIPPESNIIEDEKRIRAEFPEVNLKNFFNQIDKFAVDNFPLHDRFVALYSRLVNSVGDQINPDKAFRGHDGWLFIGNDFVHTIDKLQGRITPHLENSEVLNRIIKLSNWFQEREVDVVFVLGPEKPSVYPEMLPAIITPSEQRYINPFLDRLLSSNIKVADPTDALRERKHTNHVYFKTDSHWNQIGGSVAFESAINALDIHDCQSWRFIPTGNRRQGDLLNLVGFREEQKEDANDDFGIVWDRVVNLSEITKFIPEARVVGGRFFENHNTVREEIVWVIGDSFRHAMLPFFSVCFSKTASIPIAYRKEEHIHELYENLSIKPSRVVFVVNERNF